MTGAAATVGLYRTDSGPSMSSEAHSCTTPCGFVLVDEHRDALGVPAAFGARPGAHVGIARCRVDAGDRGSRRGEVQDVEEHRGLVAAVVGRRARMWNVRSSRSTEFVIVIAVVTVRPQVAGGRPRRWRGSTRACSPRRRSGRSDLVVSSVVRRHRAVDPQFAGDLLFLLAPEPAVQPLLGARVR